MSAALHELTAVELARAYRSRALSPVDVAHAVLQRIQACEDVLHAAWLCRPELALRQAEASARRFAEGSPLSLLDGIPYTLKDNVATAGDPMPLGTAAADMRPMPVDAPAAARLRESGAVLVAKTTMPDYGMLSSGLSSFHALARNPWDPSKTPGGSSSGAGAAAAAGYGPLHVGTDIGGSIRLPAGWCGITGLKPSLGRIPIDPPYTGRAAGPMTRTVADAALMMQVLSLPDARDSMSLPFTPIEWDKACDPVRPLRGLRIGLLLDAGCGLAVDPEVREAVAAAARQFESAGATIEPMRPFLTWSMLDGMDHFWRMRSYVEMKNLPAPLRERVLAYIRAWADSAASMSGEAVFNAGHQFYTCRVATVRACEAFDFVLSPVSPVPAFPADFASPTNDPMRPLAHIAFTVPFNMSEQPALSVNCGYTRSGLPIGLQIAGRRFDDLGVLQVGHAFELLRGPQRAWPEPPFVASGSPVA